LITSSSVESTNRTLNGGSKWPNPNKGGFEQLVTNFNWKRIEKNKTN